MSVSYVNQFRRGHAVWALGVIAALAGCSRAPDPARKANAGAEQVFRYGDRAGSTSRVDRIVAADGSERLHGESEITAGAAITRVVEDATLAPDGRLVRAEVTVLDGCGDRPAQKAIFEPAARVARLESPSGSVVMPVPDDGEEDSAPWAYVPVAGAAGEAAATPVAAWITYRAARAAGERGAVKVVDVRARRAVRSPSDQLAVGGEAGTTVVLGWDAGDVGPVFVDRVRLTGRGIALGLVTDGAGPALACGQVASSEHRRVE